MIPERLNRIARAIQKILSKSLAFEIYNDDLSTGIEITKVEPTKDLKIARIYYNIINPSESKIKKVKDSFERTNGFFRKKIASELNLRYTPELVFKYDKEQARGDKILKILDDIKKDEE